MGKKSPKKRFLSGFMKKRRFDFKIEIFIFEKIFEKSKKLKIQHFLNISKNPNSKKFQDLVPQMRKLKKGTSRI